MPAEEKEQRLLDWNGPSRPFKRRSRDFYVTIVSISVLFGVVLFLIEGIMPVILLGALVFLFYVLFTVEPEKIQYEVTNLGIKIGAVRTDWGQMGRFWFAERFGSELLVVETGGLAGRLEIVFPADKKEELVKILSKYLTHEKASPSFVDNAASWLSKKLPNS